MMDAITALDYHTVLIRFQEFIVKNDCPLSVEDFSLAMCHKGRADSFSANILCRKGFESVRKLPFGKNEDLRAKERTSLTVSK